MRDLFDYLGTIQSFAQAMLNSIKAYDERADGELQGRLCYAPLHQSSEQSETKR